MKLQFTRKPAIALLFGLMLLGSISAWSQQQITFTWNVEAGTLTKAFTFQATAGTDNIFVDWGDTTTIHNGDGTIDVTPTHTYTATGSYNVIVSTASGTDVFTALNVNFKDLTALDVSGCADLTHLSCSANQLPTLDVSGCTNLTHLSCSYNQLTDLDVSGCTNLDWLDCVENQLTDLDVSGATALIDLLCYNNQLTNLDVSHNTTLAYLYCWSNQLNDLDVSNNTALAYLDCSYNQLTDLNVSSNTLLTGLGCANNQLTTLDVSNNPLTYLDCGTNAIPLVDLKAISDQSITNTHLGTQTLPEKIWNSSTAIIDSVFNGSGTIFDVKLNGITATSGIDYSIASGEIIFLKSGKYVVSMTNPALNSLNTAEVIDQYNVSSSKQITFTWEVATGGNSKYFKLEATAGTDNIIVDWGDGLSDTLSATGVVDSIAHTYAIPDNAYSVAIANIDLATEFMHLEIVNSNLTALDVSMVPELEKLLCYSNQLQTLDLSNNISLTHLQCHNNLLTSLDVSACPNLELLYCASNQLTSLNVNACPNLIDLRCQMNKLTSLDVSACTSIATLHCQSNRLQDIGLSNSLSELNCENNIIPLINLEKISQKPITNKYLGTQTLDTLDWFSDKAIIDSVFFGTGGVTYGVTLNGSAATLGVDYSIVSGEITFNKPGLFSITIGNTTGMPSNPSHPAKVIANFNVTLSQQIFFTWNATENVSKEFSLRATSGSNNISIDWGDSNTETVNGAGTSDVSLSHIYTSSDTYTVTVTTNIGTVLTKLDVKNKNISVLNVSEATTMTTLDCAQNQLTNLDVSDCKALEILGCQENLLTALNINGCVNLLYLYCHNNQLTTLDLSNSAELEILHCQENLLSALDLSNCTDLTDLNCAQNLLTTIDVSVCADLTNLNCAQNKLRELDLTVNTALTAIVCNNNAIPFVNLNQISTDHSSATNQLGTQVLDTLVWSSPTAVLDSVFNGAGTAFEVKLNNVDADTTDYIITGGEITFLKTGLYSISIKNPAILSIPSYPAEVIASYDVELPQQISFTWEATGSKSFSIRATAGINNININWGDGNTETTDGLGNGTALTLSHTYMTSDTYTVTIAAVNLTTLFTRLDIQNNNVLTIDLSKATALQNMNCSYNQLTFLDLSNCTDLVNLNCHANIIPLINLYDLSQYSSITSKYLGTQTLDTLNWYIKTATLDSVFHGAGTNFVVKLNNVVAIDSIDYIITGGDITFLKSGLYSISISNPIIVSEAPYFPAEVIASYNVLLPQKITFTWETDIVQKAFILNATAGSNNILIDWGDSHTTTDDGTGSNTSFAHTYTTSGTYSVTITCTDLTTKFTELNVANNRLLTLDVSQATALTNLDCSQNKLTDLDVNDCGALEVLQCQENLLTSLDVSNCNALTELYCNTNQLISLNVNAHATLTTLDCSTNLLDTLDMSNYTVLTRLVCSANQLTSLDVSNCSALKTLLCQDNQLTVIDVNTCTDLTTLNCHSNQLSSLDVSTCTNLKELRCRSNQLTTLDVSNCADLIFLDCALNQLTGLDLTANTVLISIDCYNNSIPLIDLNDISTQHSATKRLGTQTLDTLDWFADTAVIDSVFNGVGTKFVVTLDGMAADTIIDYSITNGIITFKKSGLYTIRISNPAIISETPYPALVITSYNVSFPQKITFAWEAGTTTKSFMLNASMGTNNIIIIWGDSDTTTYSGTGTNITVTHTYTLADNYNVVITAADLVTEFTELNVVGKDVFYLDVSTCTDLINLNCAQNKLPSLDVSKNTALTQLHCYSNKLTDLNLTNCNALEILQCQYNLLTALNLNSCTALNYLYCQSNQLTNLDLSNCKALQVVQCQENLLTDLNVNSCTALTYLNCNQNLLPNLNVNNCKALVDLNCMDNKLATLDLNNCTALTSLNCATNQLNSLNLNNCKNLTHLNCEMNKLTSLDLTAITALQSIICYTNAIPLIDLKNVSDKIADTDFKMLGTQTLDTLDWYTYTAIIDSVFHGVGTIFTVKYNNVAAIDGSDYTITSGIITFKKSGLYEITIENSAIESHSSYPAKVITSYNVTLPQQIVFTWETSTNSKNFSLRASSGTGNISIDWGDGSPISTYSGNGSSADVTPAHTYAFANTYTVTITTNTGSEFTELNVADKNLLDINVSQATSLIYLYCQSNRLVEIDLTADTVLTTIACYDNIIPLVNLHKISQNSITNKLLGTQTLDTLDWYTGTAILDSVFNGINTIFDVKLNDTTAIDGIDYSITNGVITFIKSGLYSISISNPGIDSHVSSPAEVIATYVVALPQIITFTWEATTDGSKNFILQATSGTNNITIDWGDSSTETHSGTGGNGIISHNYTAGVYTVIVTASGANVFMGLNVTASNLTDLDVSGCTDLTYLNCNDNQLQNLSVSECAALLSLNCSSNELTSLDMSTCLVLTELYCASNQLSTLDVSHNSALRYLACDNNLLTTLNLNNNTNLVQLSCDANQLNSLQLNNCAALEELNCNNNLLTSLDVSNNAALTDLYCAANQLSTLDVSYNSALLYLACGNNQLTTLNLNNNTNLLQLSCEANQLNSLQLNNCTALEELNCNSNKLEELELTANNALTTIVCYDNAIPLINLYEISDEHLSADKYLGTQTLDTLTWSTNTAILDSVFYGIGTTFVVVLNGTLATDSDDYSIVGGVITFKKSGLYEITISNPEIISHSSYPAKVIIGYDLTLNNDATLATLTVSEGTLTPIFDSDTLNYNVIVGYDIDTIEINATATHPNAIVSGTGIYPLSLGNNSFDIVVTAEDNSYTQTYTVNVYRQSNEVKLATLTVSEGTLNPTFHSDTLDYNVIVRYNISSLDIEATAADSNATVSGTGTKTINVGDNSFEIVVTAEDNSYTRTYTVNIHRMSNNNMLDTLIVSEGTLTPIFHSDTLNYNVVVGYDIDAISFAATTVHPMASVDGLGLHSLAVGNNSFDIVVTAEDNIYLRRYIIDVYRQSNDATLATLTVSEGTLDPVFHSDTLIYKVAVNFDLTTIDIDATTTHPNATISGIGTHSLSGSDRSFDVIVTAEDISYTQTYTINLRHKSNDASLASLTVSEGTLNPVFDSETLSYHVIVGYDAETIDIDATSTHPDATISGTGTHSLNVGNNSFEIVVTAEDNNYTQTYTITIYRQSNDANLATLTVSEGTLDPVFNPATLSYNVIVSHSISSLIIAATAAHPNATVSGTGTKSLEVGDNIFEIIVTAEDITYTQTYTVNVHRKSNDATLASLTVSEGTISPAFHPATLIYNVNIGYDITSFIIEATTTNPNATITGTGIKMFNIGHNRYELVVTAEDNNYRQTYIVNVMVPLCGAILQVWDDVLTIVSLPENNGGYSIIGYQWYKNGAKMVGQTRASIRIAPGDGGVYHAILTDELQNEYRTCDYAFSVPLNSLIAYPNPANSKITIKEEHIKSGDIIEVYAMNGSIVGRFHANGKETTIDISRYAQGIYLVRVNRKEIKIVKN